MLDTILWFVWTLLKAASIFVVPYLLYHRVIDYYRCKAHYGSQSVVWQIPGAWGDYPLFGNVFSVLRA